MTLQKFRPDRIFVLTIYFHDLDQCWTDLTDANPYPDPDILGYIPFDVSMSDLEGDVNEKGEWIWNGEGDPRDNNGTTIIKIIGVKD